MMSRSPRASLKALGGMATGLMLSACADNYATQGPITVDEALGRSQNQDEMKNMISGGQS